MTTDELLKEAERTRLHMEQATEGDAVLGFRNRLAEIKAELKRRGG